MWHSKRKASDAFYFGKPPFKKPRTDGDPPPPDEAPHENRPRPRFSYLLIAPEEGHNVPRTLNQLEANPEVPILLLGDTFEAGVVLDCARFIDYSTMFRVFDEHNTRYNMQLLKLLRINGRGELFFNLGWTRFVNDHNLGADDQISFDKNLDTTISGDFYYILKYVKKPESSENPGDGAESSTKQDDGAESSRRPGDGAESSTKLSDDGAECSKKSGDGAECSKKSGDGAMSPIITGDTTESSSELSDDSVQSVLGIGMPVFKVIYHRILLETRPDQEHINEPRPGSRPFQLEAFCLSKTLNVTELSLYLYFDVYDAIVLTDNPRVAETLPDNSMDFMVFDRDDRQYNMTLTPFEMAGMIGFCLEGWDGFIGNHDLNLGDRVAFYKFLDRRINYGYYYVVLNLPADVDCQIRRNPFRRGSRPEIRGGFYRALMPGSYCFSKILSQADVYPGSAGLQLEAHQARHFESSRRSLSEPFMVFDWDDRQYDMKLSYYFNHEWELVCFLDNSVGWYLFVFDNNLRAGDTIHVNKTFDQSVCADHYFVITFTRMVPHGRLETEFGA